MIYGWHPYNVVTDPQTIRLTRVGEESSVISHAPKLRSCSDRFIPALSKMASKCRNEACAILYIYKMTANGTHVSASMHDWSSVGDH